MAKYIRLFDTVANASGATDLLSPNVTYIEEGQGSLLMADVGDNKKLEIKVEGGKPVIGEKSYEKVTVSLGREIRNGLCLEYYSDGVLISRPWDNPMRDKDFPLSVDKDSTFKMWGSLGSAYHPSNNYLVTSGDGCGSPYVGTIKGDLEICDTE